MIRGILSLYKKKNNIFLGVTIGAVGQLINVLYRVLTVPLFIEAWGVELYGEWLILSSVVAYLALCDFGAQNYVINRLTECFPKKSLSEFKKTLATSVFLFCVLPLSSFIVFMFVLNLFLDDIYAMFGVMKDKEVLLTFVFLSLHVLISIPQGLVVGIYRAIGQLPRGSKILNYLVLIQLITVFVSLKLNAAVFEVAFLQIIPVILVTLYVIGDLAKFGVSKEYYFCKKIDVNLIKGMMIPSFGFLLIQLSHVIQAQGIVIVVGFMLGAKELVLYHSLRTIANICKQAMGLISHTVWPNFTLLYHKKKYTELRLLFENMVTVTMYSTVIFSIILYLFSNFLLQQWIGEEFSVANTTTWLFLMNVSTAILGGLCSHLLMATNRHKVLSHIFLTYSLIMLSVAYLLGRNYGINGVLLATLACELVVSLYILPRLLSSEIVGFDFPFLLKKALFWIVILGALKISIWIPTAILFLYSGGFIKSMRELLFS